MVCSFLTLRSINFPHGSWSACWYSSCGVFKVEKGLFEPLLYRNNLPFLAFQSYKFLNFILWIGPFYFHIDEMKKLRAEYESSTEDEKRLMEKRYGKKVIERAINDSYTSEWLEEFSKQCPHCKAHIQVCSGDLLCNYRNS